MPPLIRRRDLLKSVPALAAAQETAGAAHPNIVLIISDQFRWDCIGAAGLNPMDLTPNLDAMARRGTFFRNAFCNQPVCAPARASIFTGQYPSRHGVWRNGILMADDSHTLATALRSAGYSANYIGKWHLAENADGPRGAGLGAVPPAQRGGFLNLWEASNVLELTSHAYEGDMFDGDGRPMHYSGIYRADFITQRALHFLDGMKAGSAGSPFFLTLSYLEVHHQNDSDKYVPPKEYEGRYPNPFVPEDLRPLPGSWPSQLSDYYACVAKIDETVGTIRDALVKRGLDRNTIVMFTSDHGCHFKTRNPEYKRTPHESSIHVPLIVEGPGFNRALEIPELVSQVDLMPSLLSAAGVPVPSTVQGHSFLPLLDRRTEGWRNEVFFQMSEYYTGRGLRTPRYTYAAAAPKMPGWKAVKGADRYVEFMMYDLYADPYQHVNLAGRVTHQKEREELRNRLAACMHDFIGESSPIEADWFPYA